MNILFSCSKIPILSFCVVFLIYAIYYISFMNKNTDKIEVFTKNNATNFVRKHHQEHKENLKNNSDENNDQINLVKEKIVHLDLKGAPLKVSYYSKLFPLIRKLGATGILMEYEDMFAYDGDLLQNISALTSYSIKDIVEINELAKENHLKLIPFIQMFTHLEFILKLEEFIEYREVHNFPSTICPSFNKALKLLEEIIIQIINAHPYSDSIHLGGTSAIHLGHCQRCADRLIEENLTRNELFLKHVKFIFNVVKKKKPRMNILIWDDYFRTLKPTVFEKSVNSVEYSFKPVVGWFGKDAYEELGPSLWNMYSRIFNNVWIASSFKGAFDNKKYVSDVNYYLQNHKSWISVINEYRELINIEGIIITGWQRFDHFSILAELLPVGLPTLAMALRILNGFKDSALGPPTEVAKILQCDQPYALIGTAFGSPKCKFPGGEVLENIVNLHQLQQEFAELLEDFRYKGWLSNFNQKYLYSSTKHVKSILMPLHKIKLDLQTIKKKLINSMLEIYDKYTVDEWLETYLDAFEKKVTFLWDTKQKLLEKNFWPRGPININSEI